jgi:hypothetical protein
VLAVLDDARDEEQVRPLLPSGPGCAAVVTSRRRLTGARRAGERGAAAARRRSTPARPASSCGADLTRERVARDAEGVEEVLRDCAGLPLALALAAARAAAQPGVSLATIAKELRSSSRA